MAKFSTLVDDFDGPTLDPGWTFSKTGGGAPLSGDLEFADGAVYFPHQDDGSNETRITRVATYDLLASEIDILLKPLPEVGIISLKVMVADSAGMGVQLEIYDGNLYTMFLFDGEVVGGSSHGQYSYAAPPHLVIREDAGIIYLEAYGAGGAVTELRQMALEEFADEFDPTALTLAVIAFYTGSVSPLVPKIGVDSINVPVEEPDPQLVATPSSSELTVRAGDGATNTVEIEVTNGGGGVINPLLGTVTGDATAFFNVSIDGTTILAAQTAVPAGTDPSTGKVLTIQILDADPSVPPITATITLKIRRRNMARYPRVYTQPGAANGLVAFVPRAEGVVAVADDGDDGVITSVGAGTVTVDAVADLGGPEEEVLDSLEVEVEADIV